MGMETVRSIRKFLFVWVFSSHSRIFHSYGDVNIAGEEFFNVPHLLWHGASIYNGHLREPVALTPIAERLAVEHPACPKGRSTQHNDSCLDLLESIC